MVCKLPKRKRVNGRTRFWISDGFEMHEPFGVLTSCLEHGTDLCRSRSYMPYSYRLQPCGVGVPVPSKMAYCS